LADAMEGGAVRRRSTVTVRLTSEEAQRLSGLSEQTLRTRSDIVRLLLRQAELHRWEVVLGDARTDRVDKRAGVGDG